MGLYGVEPGKFHRAVLSVDRWKASFFLDGKRIFDQADPAVGPGRAGLAAWGGKTTLAVRRLRLLEIPPGKRADTFLRPLLSTGKKSH